MLTDINQIFLLVLTKADKVKAQDMYQEANKIIEYVKGAGSLCIPVVHCVSALSSQKDKSLGYGMFEFMSNLIYHID